MTDLQVAHHQGLFPRESCLTRYKYFGPSKQKRAKIK